MGYYSLVAFHANPDARVISAEPVPENWRRLRTNQDLNAASLTLVQKAIADEKGERDFWFPTGGIAVRSAFTNGDDSRQTGWSQGRVSVTTVDEVVEDLHIETLDLLKVDVEGFEFQVLRGAFATIRRDAPAIILEILTREAADRVTAVLHDLEYSIFRLTDDGPQPVWGVPERIPEWRNYLLLNIVRRPQMAHSLNLVELSHKRHSTTKE